MRDYFKRIRCRSKYARFDCSNKRARTLAKRDMMEEIWTMTIKDKILIGMSLIQEACNEESSFLGFSCTDCPFRIYCDKLGEAPANWNLEKFSNPS